MAASHTAPKVYIALGSNLADPNAQLNEAISRLRQVSGITITAYSSIYSSHPVGPQDQPDYANAVVEITTNLSPQTLLKVLKNIEAEQGRTAGRRWGERLIDLDIILYGNQEIRTPDLTIPHLEMANRNFVLLPLAEIAPHTTLPCGTTILALIDKCPDNPLHKIGAFKH
ncbi:2-amino-4-hydroxy-6- hydroxymethyldihydropteridine diphosphokinase [Oleiphilus messinensis]|uniref:2-amino-4-hydroxy-6-hydroxymethyldihydropteridine pyrophosphokinase n=1 Tax=Oleiphilus messinensis TaxID=141451 RepID=A0A1Y0IDI6_9GAMM|nr:2-amino-4-hydroxy-6-hydroxymethyldihydropteridine diphosphokinase [Oleiphilus messinensis]ARU58598.1 2-amino-4-hydroxy-6- hydroxymethyldihydropteridine diphosphokinase [Oleiphilus messinensis]